MPEATISFLKGDSVGAETDYRDSLPVNMTGIIRPIMGVDGYMIETPGITAFTTGSGIDRGANFNERFNQHYRLSGSKFISLSQTGVKTELGTILGSLQGSFPYSFETQGIVADGKFYLYDPVNGFRQVTDPDVRTPIDGVWIDGYYCLTDGEFLYHTEIVAGTPIEDQIQPLALATAEFSPDPTIGVGRTMDNKWIAFNRYTTEFFRNVGGDTFAFQREQGRAMNVGIVGTHMKTQLEDAWFFVGSRKGESVSVFGMGVGTAEKIASREIEKILAEYAESELAVSVLESLVIDGYSYLILHLQAHTLMFNYTLSKKVGHENAWSQLTSGTNGSTWIAKNGIYDTRNSYWIYGSKDGPAVGRLDTTSAEQYGEIQEWYLDTPFINIETASVDELDIQTIPGFTSTLDATVFCSVSFNGVTFGMERTINYGLPTVYGQRFITRRLCYVADWFKIRLRGASRSRMVFSKAVLKYG